MLDREDKKWLAEFMEEQMQILRADLEKSMDERDQKLRSDLNKAMDMRAEDVFNTIDRRIDEGMERIERRVAVIIGTQIKPLVDILLEVRSGAHRNYDLLEQRVRRLEHQQAVLKNALVERL